MMYPKFDKEEKRQVVHIFLGCSLVFLLEIGFISQVGEKISLDFIPMKPEAFVLFLVFLFGLGLSFFCKNYRVPVLDFFLKLFERDEVRENAPGKGAVLGAFGSFLVLFLFSLRISKASILVLTFGDSISNLVGTNFGFTENPLNRNKSVEGTLSGFLSAMIVAGIYFPILVSAAASFGALIAESFSHIFNDNVSVPLISGLIFYLF